MNVVATRDHEYSHTIMKQSRVIILSLVAIREHFIGYMYLHSVQTDHPPTPPKLLGIFLFLIMGTKVTEEGVFGPTHPQLPSVT